MTRDRPKAISRSRGIERVSRSDRSHARVLTQYIFITEENCVSSCRWKIVEKEKVFNRGWTVMENTIKTFCRWRKEWGQRKVLQKVRLELEGFVKTRAPQSSAFNAVPLSPGEEPSKKKNYRDLTDLYVIARSGSAFFSDEAREGNINFLKCSPICLGARSKGGGLLPWPTASPKKVRIGKE